MKERRKHNNINRFYSAENYKQWKIFKKITTDATKIGITKSEIANSLGVSSSLFSHWLKGDVLIDDKKVRKLRAVLTKKAQSFFTLAAMDD